MGESAMPQTPNGSGITEPIDIMSQEIISSTKLPIIVYHYTNAKGFKGIIESKKIWFSEATYLNDSSEVEHGLRLVKQELDSFIEEYGPNNLKRHADADGSAKITESDLAKHNLLKMIKEKIANKKEAPVYVACFCLEDNLLSQWRTYGREGGGFSIGFEIDPSALAQHNGWAPLKGFGVVYKCQDQIAYIRRGIQTLLARLDHDIVTTPIEAVLKEGNINMVVFYAQDSAFLLPMCYGFKDPGFDVEQEWRLCVADGTWKDLNWPSLIRYIPEFREGNNLLIPYIEMSIDNDACKIVSVTCGPGPQSEQSVRSANVFLKKHGY